MKTRVLDSWPIMEWISGTSPASDTVVTLLADAEAGRARLLMSAINAGEVYYFLRKHGRATLAEEWRESCRTLPVTIEVPTAQDIWDAASLKAQFAISYADAFGAALALKHRCALVTGDPEFRLLKTLKLEWIGKP